ncbi:MAG: hypothetical protein JNM84_17330 [Planctomycetes bacterium]|nr:hypothetical protein [Planctomycetota bacterium]
MRSAAPVSAPARLFALFALAPLAVVLGLAVGPDPAALRAAQPLVHREGGYIGSGACLACHPDQHASWSRTYHATMTQRPEPQRVRGRFDGTELAYLDQRAVPLERAGKFSFRLDEGGRTREAEVAKLVGSRRYQQYFERIGAGEDDASFRRLPWLWHIEAERWLHVNTIFLGPDDATPGAHLSRWNENCIFCHNTAPRPGMEIDRAPSEARFDSEVAELGIACEACHGPGETHAARHRDPLARYLRSGAPDPTLVDPAQLEASRASAVCGQCHAQRLPEPVQRIRDYLTQGPSYRPGDRLEDHVKPLQRDTPPLPGASPHLFADRFWADGTPRLSAYEYQGMVSSACFAGGELSCLSCHAMHRGEREGQLAPEKPGDALCTSCHAEIGREVAAHTKHAPESSGSRCVECHMPRIAYGILDLHRSHRIEVPDPKRDAELARPNACTLCHLERSSTWAVQERARLWGLDATPPASRGDGAPLELPDALAQLFAGDAVQRAAAARALGRRDAATPPRERAAQVTALLLTLGDGYPSIRWIAKRSLLELEAQLSLGLGTELEQFDTLRGLEERRRRIEGLLEAFARRAPARFEAPRAEHPLLGADFRWKRERVLPLLDLQTAKSRILSIGE